MAENPTATSGPNGGGDSTNVSRNSGG